MYNIEYIVDRWLSYSESYANLIDSLHAHDFAYYVDLNIAPPGPWDYNDCNFWADQKVTTAHASKRGTLEFLPTLFCTSLSVAVAVDLGAPLTALNYSPASSYNIHPPQ